MNKRYSWNKFSKETAWNPKKKWSDYDHFAYDTVHNTSRWRTLRKLYLAQHPLCEICSTKDNLSYSNVVDHKIAIQDGGKEWDETNLQALCYKCHRIKTQEEINNRKRLKK